MNFYKEYCDRIKWLDAYLEAIDRWKIKDENSPYFGTYSYFNMLREATEASYAGFAARLYCCKESKYYNKEETLEFIISACKAELSKLHEDGTLDLLETNFYTPEQFGLNAIACGALNLKKYLSGREMTPLEKEALDTIKYTVSRLADGCALGGFHTPNHRWISASGLLLAYELLDKVGYEKYYNAAKKFMDEGIDCDEMGEFSERSAGMYNSHCDAVFINIYLVTGEKAYLDAVCRNLDLMEYYINDDFTMYTQNSRRKDKGETGGMQKFMKATTYYAELYFSHYVMAAYLTGNARYAMIAKKIAENAAMRGSLAGFNHMTWLQDGYDVYTHEYDIDGLSMKQNFELFQPKSGIVRIRHDGFTYTFLDNNTSFLQIDGLGIHAGVRLCASFFAVAQFAGEKIEKTENGYKLSMKAHGEYKLPLDEVDGTESDYWSIDQSKRRRIHATDLELTVEADFCDGGVDLKVGVCGCDNVPVKMEIAMNPGHLCEIGDAVMIGKSGGNALAKSGSARIESEKGGVMTVDGLFCKHLYFENMRGSLSPVDGAFTLYLTEFSPLERTIKIRTSKAISRRIF